MQEVDDVDHEDVVKISYRQLIKNEDLPVDVLPEHREVGHYMMSIATHDWSLQDVHSNTYIG